MSNWELNRDQTQQTVATGNQWRGTKVGFMAKLPSYLFIHRANLKQET